MTCPLCGGDGDRYVGAGGVPRTVQGVLIRRHVCRECRHQFMSAQVVITPALAPHFLSVIESVREETE